MHDLIANHRVGKQIVPVARLLVLEHRPRVPQAFVERIRRRVGRYVLRPDERVLLNVEIRPQEIAAGARRQDCRVRHFMEASRYFESPVSRLNSPNSRIFEPISARLLLAPCTAPVRKLTKRYGAPLGDFVKHGKTRSAKSRARSRKN